MPLHLITQLRSCLIATSAVLALNASACGGASFADPLPQTSTDLQISQPEPDNIQALADDLNALGIQAPSKLLSAGDEGFLRQHAGAEYAQDLNSNLCSAIGSYAAFSPVWDNSGLNPSSDAAWCIYRFDLSTVSPGSGLSLNWSGTDPDSGNCWIGLSDWAGDAWDWYELPSTDSIAINNPSMYSFGAGNCLAAVVVLGSSTCNLFEIGFGTQSSLTYPIVDTGQEEAYDDQGNVISPLSGQAYYGQDSQYNGLQFSYTDNGDGTITDNITGLMWAKNPNNMEKVTFGDAFTVADNLTLGGYDDWRVPTIKELYSLIDFRGITGTSEFDAQPYLDTNYFDFTYGDESQGERHIDAQYWSSTEYVGTTMGGSPTTFGVNFADGRIKGYGRINPQSGEMTQFIRCVRGSTNYGVNNYTDNGDGTITDNATGLTWMQADSGDLSAGPGSDGAMNWQEALAWAENLDYADHTDWRLPNAKELQSIVDYSHSPSTDGLPAIDELFSCTGITDEGGNPEYAFYWSSTSHLDGPPDMMGSYGCYVAFGTALGFMEIPPGSGNYTLMDVHGAGAQRSDPKDGNPDDYPNGHGPQGDVIRIFNMVRCVRGGLDN